MSIERHNCFTDSHQVDLDMDNLGKGMVVVVDTPDLGNAMLEGASHLQGILDIRVLQKQYLREGHSLDKVGNQVLA